jgi:L-2,4-diaminobutyric acid acetyltransferase
MARLAFRPPTLRDAARIWRFAPQRGTAAQDSCYAFVLLCSHFSDTGIVAEEGDALVGYALGYRPPIRPDDAFVWQLGVATGRDRGELVPRLLEEFLARRANQSARFLCITASPKDQALREELQQVARRLSTRCAVEPCFPADMFDGNHPGEDLLRVGPVSA